MVRKRYSQQLSLLSMQRCFHYFDEMQFQLQRGAIAVIVYHWRKYVKQLKLERKSEKVFSNKSKANSRNRQSTKKVIQSEVQSMNKSRRGSVSKNSRQPLAAKPPSTQSHASAAPQKKVSAPV